ncbi:Cof-type HAD-IIB family hydrolase [Levilactobacillus suantsaii]|uniref:Cof-type HAD-IIB family hydrolase n=1 Tax=Levilactobacillus suantsaii TaxID=2292255 RepID=A0A4Q0VHC2_9LACO|nr:Cof-type HAD-IIB family hydrolase [Levilactobacillus suantsaii]QMU07343.1 Cof-type HAD-IIB family hydrolase [Levilactobacillus suantsaii]RXI76791.1 Cof-type HAD-IIB family hydrolase [Levilactobacillus suantsaii]
MERAVVFFDLDGTLFDEEKNVLPSSIAAIKQMKTQNVLPVIATGRNIFEIQYVLDATGIDDVVSANGSYVQYQGKKLSAAVIPQKTLTAITAFAKEQGDPLGYFNNRGFRLSQATDDTRENFKLLRLNAVVDPEWYQTQDINFLNVFNRDKVKLYQQHFAGQLSFVRNNPRALDTMVTGVNKQTGIRTFLREAHLEDAKTYAFGDGLNDLQMFDEVDVPISMGNGVARAKEKAAYVTATNLEDGIVKGLRHFDLIAD